MSVPSPTQAVVTVPRSLALAFLVALPAPGCAQAGPEDASVSGIEAAAIREAAPREFRGAWVATVANIDWPSKKGLPVATQRAELTAILDRAAELRLNALIFQVRPMCDALYPSRLEPWSEWLTGKQGLAPDPPWDPLAFAIAGAHARGLELHAWFNPYRARHVHAKSAPARNHVSRRLGDAVVSYAGQLWLDPSDDRASEHTLRVILDVVRRYDIDGVHIDDYFYPYPKDGEDFPDYRRYRSYRRAGGKLGRADWRRASVDAFVSTLHRRIKEADPRVKFGISPFGIARPGVPKGIQAGLDQYGHLFADVQRWWNEGWCDYLAPQLYWPIDQRAQSYPVLLDWWVAQNTKGRHLWPGNYTSKTLEGWSVREIRDQVEVTRSTRGATGNIHFSMKALQRGGAGAGLGRVEYARPALVPASPWLDGEAPAAPSVVVARRSAGATVLRWQARDGKSEDPARRWAVYTRSARGGWMLRAVYGRDTLECSLSPGTGGAIVFAAVTGIDRCGNESLPAVAPLR